MSESRLAHYILLDRIGEGGMGAVYRARDERLGRTVAIKTLHDGGLADPEQRRRFLQEAQAASSLNHPNIVTVYDIGREGEGGLDFIAMEYVEGEPLSNLLARGEAGVALALRVGIPVASALAAAHAAGIVHRDLKPGNVMQTQSGVIKLLDFGLAKLNEPARPAGDATTRANTPQTATGVVVGTPAYMAPEQIEGRAVDARADVFAFGLLLHELLTGTRAFRASSDLALLGVILRDAPEPIGPKCRDCPAALNRLVERCLSKDPAQRPQDAGEVLAALQRIQMDWQRRDTLLYRWSRPRRVLAVAALAALLLGYAGYRHWEQRRESTQLEADIAEVQKLLEIEHRVEAFGLLRELDVRAADDPRLQRLWNDLTFLSPLRTQPSGAQLWVKAYERPDSPWIDVGLSSEQPQRVAIAHARWRIELPGYEPLEIASRGDLESVRLIPLGEQPEGMNWVAGGPFSFATLSEAQLEGFWLDRSEVSNADFQRFVEAGGYSRPELWQEPIMSDGRVLEFEQAMAMFRDSTGRPGPAHWELGQFPAGRGEHPVVGVSWYEAMAYARFADKSLPTAHHWMRAAGHDVHSDVVNFANFDGADSAPVASRNALSPFGHHDLAGNVAEWVATGDDSHRLTLGGHWASSPYLFNDLDGADPLTRSPHIGFRCARFDGPLPEVLMKRPAVATGDYPEPVSDEVFAAFTRFYRHDTLRQPAKLLARFEGEHGLIEDWQLPTDYSDEHFRLRLYLPAQGQSPHQLVVYGPPSTALFLTNLDQAGTRDFAFLLRQGRAVAHPVFYGTYERRLPPDAGSQARRATRANWSKDVGVVLDYLATRDDIDSRRIAYYGFSLGANVGISMLAVEPRFATGILQATGFYPTRPVPENDPVNFAPRVRQPVLMIGGRYDFQNPVATSQQPLFDRLGTAPEDKSMFLFEGGHVAPRQQEIMGVILDWLDERLGPVESAR